MLAEGGDGAEIGGEFSLSADEVLTIAVSGVGGSTGGNTGGGGTFVIPDHGQRGDVLVAVRPSAIVVSTQPPQSSSARNTWQAKITGLTLLADRVRLDLDGQPGALVDVTPAAVSELSLDPGSQVWLTVKATDLEVYPHNGVR